MSANYLEQLLAEWYEYQGYFLRRNVMVGKRKKGGYECELDIVGLHPVKRHLLHVEPSMDAMTWEKREVRYRKKYEAGEQYIHHLFEGFGNLPKKIDHQAVFVFASNRNHPHIGGMRVVHLREVLRDIFAELRLKSIFKNTIPEHLAVLRSFQFVAEYRKTVFNALKA